MKVRPDLPEPTWLKASNRTILIPVRLYLAHPDISIIHQDLVNFLQPLQGTYGGGRVCVIIYTMVLVIKSWLVKFNVINHVCSVTGRSTVGRLTSGFGRPSVDWKPGSVDRRSTDPTDESYSNFLMVPGWSSVDPRSTEHWYRSTASRPKAGRLSVEWSTCYWSYRFSDPGRLPVDWCTNRSTVGRLSVDCRGVSSPSKVTVSSRNLVRSTDRSTDPLIGRPSVDRTLSDCQL